MANPEHLPSNEECPGGRLYSPWKCWSCREGDGPLRVTMIHNLAARRSWQGMPCLVSHSWSPCSPSQPMSRLPSGGIFFGLTRPSPTRGLESVYSFIIWGRLMMIKISLKITSSIMKFKFSYSSKERIMIVQDLQFWSV